MNTMIYGHEIDRGWSTSNLFCCAAVGVALGVAVGLLFAPVFGVDPKHAIDRAARRPRRQPPVIDPCADFEARPFGITAAPAPAMLE